MYRTRRCRSTRLFACLLVPGTLLATASPVHAALLGLVPTYPDITTNATDINYAYVAGAGGTLTINGSAASNLVQQTIKFSVGDFAHYICAGTTASCNPNSTYSLTANFDVGGNFTGGSLSILGYVDASTASGYQAYAGLANTGTLLTANLTGFGFNGSSATSTYDNLVLEFGIAAYGGDLFSAYGSGNGLRWSGRVNSGGSAVYGGNWDLQAAPMTQSFACTGTSCASTLNTFIPVPAAVWLFGSGLAGLMGIAARARKARVG